MKRSLELALGTAVIIGFVGLTSVFQNMQEYRIKYKEARNIAVRIFGDNKEPLTEEERANWYSCMDISRYNSPSKKQLEIFLESKK